ncbi:hypothetical protein D9758_017052 [Tetrapyrgos nigripes]|uniref:Glucose-methanol-choline oxidoreductase N-terminal domain-containing protein n=1 Tax=Tetrapyrgos nigripes TaxID=182062 RepID=A0A8H5FNR6_9AGAR|nr:hypothetical protein D9758_017052 [Tetrapyrgos nigripes]
MRPCSSLSAAFQVVSAIAVILSPVLSLVRAESTLYTNPNDLPTKEYDFIIVGAGTAGNVLAARLSEDPSKRVLVIEAGVDDTGVLPVQVPFLAFNNEGTPTDWNYTTVPQKELNNRTISVPRGFCLGGSSSINLMIWTRGSSEIWDHYAQVTGDSGWSWNALEKYWDKISTFVPPTSNPSILPPPPNDLTLSNGDGPVLVTRANAPTELDWRVINTSMLIQQEEESNGESPRFKFTEDMNTGDSIGFGYHQSASGKGERRSSAATYLHPALNNRSNLDVLIHTRAMRLVQDNSTNDYIPVFNQVEVAQAVGGPRFTFRAKNEIILSSGSIGTPQILLLSGVGPKSELEDMGIEVVVDKPGVGKNLREHAMLVGIYNVNSNMTSDDLLRSPALQQQALEQWQNNRTGRFADSASNVLGFMRIPDGQLNGAQDPTSGPHTPHFELLFADNFVGVLDPLPEQGHFITVVNVVLAPQSTGSLTLSTAEGGTFTQPLIDYSIYSDPVDVQVMLQAMNDTETFLSSSPWTQDDFIISQVGLGRKATSEEKLAFMRDNTITIFHPVGTASMGSQEESVVDPRLRVRGVKGIRVVDASVFPTMPECHPQAVVYTLAERAADIIKEDNEML